MLSKILTAVALAILWLSPAQAWYKGVAGTQYANSCGTQPVGQSWCVGTDGWTVWTPIAGPYTGSCSAGTYSVTAGGALASCGIYVSDTGTGSLTQCRIALTPSFDPTFFPASDADACPLSATTVAGLRNNSPDFLLMKRGGYFIDPDVTPNPGTGLTNLTTSYGIVTSGSTRNANFSRQGLSASQPMVIMAAGPVATARPIVSTINNCLTLFAASLSYIAMVDIECTPTFRDPNSAYYPGVIVAGASVAGSNAAGQKVISLAAPLPAYMGSSDVSGWNYYNFSNQTQMQAAGPSLQISTVDGTRTQVALFANIPAGWDINPGDRIYFQSIGTGVYVTSATSNWLYLEGNKFKYTGAAIQPTTAPNSVYIRRNACDSSYTTAFRAQCIFLGDTLSASSTVLFDENVTSHAGWLQVDNDCVPGQIMPSKCGGVASPIIENAAGPLAVQSQGAYVHELCCSPTFVRNITAGSAGSGYQTRPGGTDYNNFVARTQTGAGPGGRLVANNSTYNVVTQSGGGYVAILPTSGATVSDVTLTFAQVPQMLVSGSAYRILNATNPASGVTGTRTVTGVSNTTVTVNGANFSASSGDTIYFIRAGYGDAQLGMTYESVSLVAGNGQTTNSQWNIMSDAVPLNYGGIYGGQGHMLLPSVVRVPGSVVANNYVMNWNLGFVNNTTIRGIDATGCGGAARVTTSAGFGGNGWIAGDTATISGAAGISGVNGTWPVTVPDATHICLVGSTPSGTWTSGTGVINGGVNYNNNWVYNTATADSPAGSVIPGSFTPVTSIGCPTAVGCPTIEAYASSIGLAEGTLAHFMNCALDNRKGAYNTACTAPAANNYIRSRTDAAIPLQ